MSLEKDVPSITQAEIDILDQYNITTREQLIELLDQKERLGFVHK